MHFAEQSVEQVDGEVGDAVLAGEGLLGELEEQGVELEVLPLFGEEEVGEEASEELQV